MEIDKSQLGSQFTTGVCESLWFQKASQSRVPELQLYTPNHKSAFHCDGEDACASASWQNHLSFYLLIFIIAQSAHPSILWPCF